MSPVQVLVKGSTITVYPAFKVEEKMKTVAILKALNIVEDEYKKMVAKRDNPEVCHELIIGKYPHRLAINDVFKPLAETDFRPENW